MKDSRRNFLKKSTLTLFGFSLLGTNSFAAKSKPEACSIATLDYYGQGPFYTPNAPSLQNNELASSSEAGTRLNISGVITNLDCSAVLPNTTLEIWHANDNGDYDNSGFNLRGKVVTDSNGNYELNTILPGKYLNGNEFRPAHIHFKIIAPGASPFITQLYFEGDSSIPGDAAASITSGQFDARDRIIPLTTDANGMKQGYWAIALDAEPQTTSVNDIHTEKGMIYSISPNPINDKVAIKYGVFKKDNVEIQVVDSSGNIIQTLVKKTQKPNKYDIVWSPEKKLAVGIYYLIMKINDLQVSYQKLLKK